MGDGRAVSAYSEIAQPLSRPPLLPTGRQSLHGSSWWCPRRAVVPNVDGHAISLRALQEAWELVEQSMISANTRVKPMGGQISRISFGCQDAELFAD